MPIRRTLKNVVKKYSEAEVKVRDATSSDPWGPSRNLMEDIAKSTYNPVELAEIMGMIWRRLTGDPKQWRHKQKALQLLEYLIIKGNGKVADRCRENIHIISSLKQFQYFEGSTDFGRRVSFAAQEVYDLLHDSVRLEEERKKLNFIRERLAGRSMKLSDSNTEFLSDNMQETTLRSSIAGLHMSERSLPSFYRSTSPRGDSRASTELELFRPKTLDEEELQLQAVVQMSKNEYDQDECNRRQEQVKLQMAIEESKREYEDAQKKKANHNPTSTGASRDGVGLFSLVDTSLSAAPANLPDPWAVSTVSGPVASTKPAVAAPTSSTAAAALLSIDDPWSSPVPPVTAAGAKPAVFSGASAFAPTGGDDIWSLQTSFGPALTEISANNNNNAASLFGAEAGTVSWFPANGSTATGFSSDSFNPEAHSGGAVTQGCGEASTSTTEEQTRRHTPADFLGEHKRLVDLDRLIVVNPASTNPFAVNPRDNSGGAPSNPFLAPTSKPSLNELAPDRAVGAQLALPATTVLPRYQTQPCPTQNYAMGGAGGSTANAPLGVPVFAFQSPWATTPQHMVSGSPYPSNSTTSMGNPFY